MCVCEGRIWCLITELKMKNISKYSLADRGNILLHADGGFKVARLNKQQFTACLSWIWTNLYTTAFIKMRLAGIVIGPWSAFTGFWCHLIASCVLENLFDYLLWLHSGFFCVDLLWVKYRPYAKMTAFKLLFYSYSK